MLYESGPPTSTDEEAPVGRTEAPGQSAQRTNCTPTFYPARVPAQLRERAQWVLWRFEQKPGEKKPRKVPYWANGKKRWGVHGSPADRRNLVDFDTALRAATRDQFSGVGFCPLPDDTFTFLDFDNCVDANGRVRPDVLNLVEGAYAEYSPSRTGIRSVVRGSLGDHKSHKRRRGHDDYPFGFETFDANGFVTWTGLALPDVELAGSENSIPPASEALKALCAARFAGTEAPEADDEPKAPEGWTLDQIREALDVLPDDLEYEDDRGQPSWLAVGMAVHHETGGSEEGFDLWDEWSSRSPKYSTREYGRDRWDSFGKPGKRTVSAGSLRRWANAHGARIPQPGAEIAKPEDFDDISGDSADPGFEPINRGIPGGEAPPAHKFQFQPIASFANGPSPRWWVKGLIPESDVVLIVGEPSSGKSFIAQDIMLAVARGLSWRGLRTRQGNVAWVAAEGAGGFRNRAKAYLLHHDVEPESLPVQVLGTPPNLLDKTDAIELGKAVKACGEIDVVVIDTAAQVTPGGNENSSEDMGRFLGNLRAIGNSLGVTFVVIHHLGKDASKGARGWSGLAGAADAILTVNRRGDARALKVTKQKDGQDGGEFGFRLQVVAVGFDSDGDAVESCVVVDAALPKPLKKLPVDKWQKPVTEFVLSRFEEGYSSISLEDVIDGCIDAHPPPPPGKRDRRKDRIKEAVAALDGDWFAVTADRVEPADIAL